MLLSVNSILHQTAFLSHDSKYGALLCNHSMRVTAFTHCYTLLHIWQENWAWRHLCRLLLHSRSCNTNLLALCGFTMSKEADSAVIIRQLRLMVCVKHIVAPKWIVVVKTVWYFTDNKMWNHRVIWPQTTLLYCLSKTSFPLLSCPWIDLLDRPEIEWQGQRKVNKWMVVWISACACVAKVCKGAACIHAPVR